MSRLRPYITARIWRRDWCGVSWSVSPQSKDLSHQTAHTIPLTWRSSLSKSGDIAALTSSSMVHPDPPLRMFVQESGSSTHLSMEVEWSQPFFSPSFRTTKASIWRRLQDVNFTVSYTFSSFTSHTSALSLPTFAADRLP